jgi:hypothetical protein
MTLAEVKALLTSPNDSVSAGGADTLQVVFRDPAHHLSLTLSIKGGHFSIIGEISIVTRTLLTRAELLRRAVDFIHKAKLTPR